MNEEETGNYFTKGFQGKEREDSQCLDRRKIQIHKKLEIFVMVIEDFIRETKKIMN